MAPEEAALDRRVGVLLLVLAGAQLKTGKAFKLGRGMAEKSWFDREQDPGSYWLHEGLVVVGALESEGILSTAVGGFTAGFKAEAPGWVQVMVSEEDLPVAQNTLAKLKQEIAEIDWSQVDVGEPEDE